MSVNPEILKERLRTEKERQEAALVREFWKRVLAESAAETREDD